MPLLGLWHVYKQASIQVFKLAAADFLAPLWHVMFPDKKFYLDQRFRRVTNMLSLVRLSYPKWRDALHAALQRDLPAAEKAHLENLFALVEYFIPLVSAMFVILLHFACFVVFPDEKKNFCHVKILGRNFYP